MTPVVMRFAAAQAVLGGPRPGGIGPVRFGVGQFGGSREAPRCDWQHRFGSTNERGPPVVCQRAAAQGARGPYGFVRQFRDLAPIS
jgi:hypothetical protein